MEGLLRILLLFPVLHASAYWRPDFLPGPYCGLNNQCCLSRSDQCTHKILDIPCYCDEFCKRKLEDDCCPDYEAVCMGQNQTDQPSYIGPRAPVTRQPCSYHNVFYEVGDTRKDDCNTCTCVEDLNNLNGRFWRCEADECLMSDDVMNGVNRDRIGWRAHNYTQFQGKKLKDGITYKLGTFQLTPQIMNMAPLSYKEVHTDNYFDSRDKWPGYISPVIDQGWCGSDWAVSIATIVSDRFAIESNGAEKILLSPQSLLSCSKNQRGCEGGHIDKAWYYARKTGLVDKKCDPYIANDTRCTFDRFEDGCTPAVRQRRYTVSPTGRLVKEHDIKSEIMDSGPVQAIMTVYQDFFHYKDGIYRRSPYGNNRLQGLHSVRIVGWGENYDGKFWIVANSWGREWGEDGYFNIARGNNESGIESFVVTAPVDVTEAQRK